jgi:small subunit ribosomal protein S1
LFFKNKKNNRQENNYLMEIYKDLSNPASQEFEKLLNSQLSKIQIEEGKIIEGKINKITEKFVFLFVEGLKSEPVLDINELKSMGLAEKIKIGETISVLLEKIEDKHGEVLVSASKAQKIKGWDKLVEAYEKNEPIMGKITSKCKGGCIVEHIDTGSLMFLPGSQISDKPLKDISHLMNEPQKFALIKLDKSEVTLVFQEEKLFHHLKKRIKLKLLRNLK